MVNKKKIIKNSLLLYLRMLVVTVVSLYTSRIVLRALGVEDFGIYSAIGGIIAFFTVMTTSMANATQRFLNIKKGNLDNNGLILIFSISCNLHKIISLVFLIVAEIIGSIIVIYFMNFPEGKLFEAYLVYQATILTSVFSLMRIPYMALFTTFERFDFVAWTSLLDVFFKIALVFFIETLSSYRLVAYGFTFVIMALLQNYLYLVNSRKICCAVSLSYKKTIRSSECKDLISFSSWNMCGNVSNVLANQGIAILLNIFYNVVVNAAIGLTNQVTNTIASFVNNVQQAFRPQMLQSYAKEDKKDFLSLLYTSTRWSFFLILLIAVPLICNIKYILQLWLGEYPLYTDSFITILTAYLIIDSISTPLLYGIDATGKIKEFQILVSLLYVLNFVIAWILCAYDLSPNWVIISKVLTNILIYILKLVTLKKLEKKFIISDYINKVILKILIIGTLSFIFIYLFRDNLPSFINLLKSSLLFIIGYIIAIIIIGLNQVERDFLFLRIKSVGRSFHVNKHH